jgi:hypothetical protein
MAVKLPDAMFNLLPKNMITATAYPMLKNALGTLAKKRTISFTEVVGKPQGAGRIQSFDVCNGVFSLEWLYVIYTCAYSYLPGQNNNLTYSNQNKQYDCVGDCKSECMLFRDPYYYSVDQNNTSASDLFMKLYCFTKNITIAYASYSNPATNDCSCTASMSYCPGAFDSSCDPTKSTGYNSYIPDGINHQTQVCSDTCSYCKAVNIQFNFAEGNASADFNPKINTTGQCSGNSACINGVPADGDDGIKKSIESSNTINIILMLLILVIVIVILGGITFMAVKKYKNEKI